MPIGACDPGPATTGDLLEDRAQALASWGARPASCAASGCGAASRRPGRRDCHGPSREPVPER